MNLATLWADSGAIKRATMLAALVGGVATAMIAMSNAYSVAEPYWVAQRYFVREHVRDAKSEIVTQITNGDSKQNERLIRIERTLLSADLARSLENRKTIRTRIAQFQADLVKADMPESARRIIQEQLDRLIDDQLENDRRIDELRRDLARQ